MAPSRPFNEYLHPAIPLFCASLPSDRGCDGVLGFVPGDSVSNSATLQIFRDASHLTIVMVALICQPVHLLGHFPSLRRVQGSTSTDRNPNLCDQNATATASFLTLLW